MLKYFLLFIAAAFSSFLLTPAVRLLAVRLGAIDFPDGRKIHSHPIPRLGGIAVFIVFNVLFLVFCRIEFFHFPPNYLGATHFGWLFLASLIVLGVGVVDDFRRMPYSLKFLFQIVAGLIVATQAYSIEMVDSPFGTLRLGVFAVPATVFWIIAIVNAMNLLDGLDGLAAGTSFIVALTMFCLSLLGQNVGVALVSVLLAGTLFGFLKHNFHPATIFLGDSGSYFIGFTLAVLSLQSSMKGTAAVAILIPVLALGLPIMDTAVSMLRRLLKSLHIMEVNPERKEVRFFFIRGRSMFKADRDHIHHRLIDMGLTQRKAVILLYSVSFVLGVIALSFFYFRNINHALLLTTIGIAFYVGVRKLGYEEIQLLSNGVLLPLFDRQVVNRRVLRVFVDMALISFSYFLAFFLRYEGEISSQVRNHFLSTLPPVLLVKVVVFYLSSLYRGAWRYTSVGDLIRMLKAVIMGCLASGLLLWILPGFGVMSKSVLAIDFCILLISVTGIRSSFRVLEHLQAAKNQHGSSVLIYGVGRPAVQALNEFLARPQLGLSPVGFIDDDPRYQGKKVIGYPVVGTLDSLAEIIERDSIAEVIVSQEQIPEEKLERLREICSAHQISLRRFQTSLADLSNP